MVKAEAYTTVEDFTEWMSKVHPNTRWKPMRWNTYDNGSTYLLEQAGTGSKWRAPHSVTIPQEVGEFLYKNWKTSGPYGSLVGSKSPKGIMKMLTEADIVSDKIMSDIATKIEKGQRISTLRTKCNRVQSDIAHLQSALRELVRLDSRILEAEGSVENEIKRLEDKVAETQAKIVELGGRVG